MPPSARLSFQQPIFHLTVQFGTQASDIWKALFESSLSYKLRSLLIQFFILTCRCVAIGTVSSGRKSRRKSRSIKRDLLLNSITSQNYTVCRVSTVHFFKRVSLDRWITCWTKIARHYSFELVLLAFIWFNFIVLKSSLALLLDDVITFHGLRVRWRARMCKLVVCTTLLWRLGCRLTVWSRCPLWSRRV